MQYMKLDDTTKIMCLEIVDALVANIIDVAYYNITTKNENGTEINVLNVTINIFKDCYLLLFVISSTPSRLFCKKSRRTVSVNGYATF